MGYNLNKLMKQYGVGSASKLSYAGAQDPGAEPEPLIMTQVMYPIGSPEAKRRQAIIDEWNKKYGDWKEKSDAYEADQTAYKDYTDQYDARLLNTPMYSAKQFQTQIQQQPQTREEMWEKYIGIPRPLEDYPLELMESDNTLQETTSEVTPAWIRPGPIPKPSPLSDAARQLFLRDNAYRYADLGIRNTGNQLVMDQTGNYFGNILDAPTYQPIVDSTPVDDDAGDMVIDDTVTDDTVIDDGIGNTVTDELGTIVFDDGVGSGRDLRGGFMDVGHIRGDLGGDPIYDDPYYDAGGAGGDGFKYGGPIKGYQEAGSVSNEDNLYGLHPSEEMISEIIDVEEVITPSGEEVLSKTQEVIDRYSQSEPYSNLIDIAEKYKTTTQDDKISKQQQEFTTARQQYADLVTNMASTTAKGPSESEKWFRIAAAFGAPTKSGHFMENLALVNKELAGDKKEGREAEVAAGKVRLSGLTSAMDMLQQDMDNTRGIADIERKYNTYLRDNLISLQADDRKWQRDAELELAILEGKRDHDATLPLTKYGKAAVDAGLERGTEEFAKYVRAYIDKDEQAAKLRIEIMQQQLDQLSTPEISAYNAVEKVNISANQARLLISDALAINDKTYEQTMGGATLEWLAKLIDPDGEIYKNTQILKNILTSQALTSLKATFGGNVSEGERAILLSVQGLDSRTRAERQRILERAYEVMYNLAEKTKNDMEEIKNKTKYKRTTPKKNTDSDQEE